MGKKSEKFSEGTNMTKMNFFIRFERISLHYNLLIAPTELLKTDTIKSFQKSSKTLQNEFQKRFRFAFQ